MPPHHPALDHASTPIKIHMSTMLSTFRRAATAAASRSSATTFLTASTTRRTLAMGPASGGEISDELLAKLGSLSTQALVDGLWVMGWPAAQIDGARPLHPSHRCVGRAVTLNFVPARPDIAQDKPPGENSPEYEAFETKSSSCPPWDHGSRWVGTLSSCV